MSLTILHVNRLVLQGLLQAKHWLLWVLCYSDQAQHMWKRALTVDPHPSDVGCLVISVYAKVLSYKGAVADALHIPFKGGSWFHVGVALRAVSRQCAWHSLVGLFDAVQGQIQIKVCRRREGAQRTAKASVSLSSKEIC